MTTHHHHDQLPSQRTVRQPEQEELPPVLAPEREPDQRGQRRKRGAAIVAGVLLTGAAAGFAGWRLLDSDDAHAGPTDTDRSVSADKTPGTQEQDKTPEVKLSGLTAENMPLHGPDGKEFKGLGEVQAYLNNIPMAEFPTRHAASEEFVNRLAYVTAMGITPEDVNFYSENNDLTSTQYAPQTEVELRTGFTDKVFDNTFTAPEQNMQQNRQELTAFYKNTHNAVVATANTLYEGAPNRKPLEDWEPFKITSSERSGNEDTTGESRITIEHTSVAIGRDGKYVFAMDMEPRDTVNWGVSAFNLTEMPEN